MKRIIVHSSLTLALLVAFLPFKTKAAERVDLIIRGGTVVTMDGSGRIIENGAVAVRRERIVAVGPSSEVSARYIAAHTIHAAGKIVMQIGRAHV